MKLAYVLCLKASGKIWALGEERGREKRKECERGEECWQLVSHVNASCDQWWCMWRSNIGNILRPNDRTVRLRTFFGHIVCSIPSWRNIYYARSTSLQAVYKWFLFYGQELFVCWTTKQYDECLLVYLNYCLLHTCRICMSSTYFKWWNE